jgi:multidrug efflux system membrane fusion protein
MNSAFKQIPSRVRQRLQLWRQGLYVAIALGAVVGIGTLMFHRAPAAPTPAAPVVTVATPLVRDVELWDEYVGRFAPSRAVDVRPRVSGAIIAIHFHDGQSVSQGQLLFSIDQRPYAAALAEARAGANKAVSTLALARSDFDRASRLQGDEAIAAGEVDALRARLRVAEADVASARARVEARALDVEFTEVRAPIAGRTSDRRVDLGNLVTAADSSTATLLTTIYALDPIYFSFDASEALYLKAKRQQGTSGARVQIRLQDEADYHWMGTLDFTDNAIDPRSGTIRGRATIANPDQILTPGMFGNMRMGTGAGRALLVPDSAVQSDQADRTVLILDNHDVVNTRRVELGSMAGGLRIITAGLNPTDRVIIAGAQTARSGAKALPQPGIITVTPELSQRPADARAAEAAFASN